MIEFPTPEPPPAATLPSPVSFRFELQVVYPQKVGGTDYGTPRKVLVLPPTRALWWVGGSKWSDVSGPHYTSSGLDLASGQHTNEPNPMKWRGPSLHRGGRLTSAVIEGVQEEINKGFGQRIAHLIRINRTLFVDDPPGQGPEKR